MAGRTLRIGGIEPFSTVDFPGRLATVLFCQGCPLKCGYCHNPGLIPADSGQSIGFAEALSALNARSGFIDAVVFSGGEPLAQSALRDAIDAVHALGLATALHTAGTAPGLFAALLDRLDWVGFDVKAPFDDYGPVTSVGAAGRKALQSLEHLLASGVAHEVRTTVWPDRIGTGELDRIAFALEQVGVSRFVLQECRGPDRSVWPGPSPLDDTVFMTELSSRFDEFEVRRAQN
ncbi:anaerobic ribonucleoside-triphosphate reductase activating protein [Maricaulis sp.]|uniref:anaerobic ribonucleoside-triphosphate reductase activating protein n=1 Tax=Maricaulis sp. TaxID=1486257 RepID=UPI002630B9D3|nr:anaerobic ribonucleoside-triphosphate reductase activating protein [Maricaulis sp.]